jgi:(S)-2-hydroxy-acid oxidase
LAICYNLDDFQQLAKLKLSKPFYEYLASGTDDEQTLAENRAAFKAWYLRPRVLRPVGKLSTKTNFFGWPIDMPVFASSAGLHALCHPDGECATARACGSAGIVFGLSQHATKSMDEVAQAAPDTIKFFQSYILKDRNITKNLAQRAIQLGYKGIFLTVDSVHFGYREADARNNFNALPPPFRLVHYDETRLDKTYNSADRDSWDQNSQQMFEQNVSWEDIKWMKQVVCGHDVPLILKGVMTAEDAILAVEAGADGIMVSNHGGRQLDGALAAIDALPEVVQAVAGRVPVLMDSGVRRGTDVLKALALGATAVGVGKPLFFSLAIAGEHGVSKMFSLLKTELESAMAICGVETIEDIEPSLVSRHPSGSPVMPYFRSAL